MRVGLVPCFSALFRSASGQLPNREYQLDGHLLTLLVPDPRIGDSVQQVGDQVGEDDAEDHDDGDGLHQRDVAEAREQAFGLDDRCSDCAPSSMKQLS